MALILAFCLSHAPRYRSTRLMALYNSREGCFPERKLAGVFFIQEMERDIRPAQEGFIEQAEAAATA
jgi:hypothetical protein